MVPTHSRWVSMDPLNLCGTSRAGPQLYPLILLPRSSSQNRSVSRIPFGCRERCSRVLMLSSITSSSAVSPQCVWVCTYTCPFMTLFGGSAYYWLPETFAGLPQVDWSGPSPYQSARMLDQSDPSPKITRTGPGLNWIEPVQTGPHPDYWNYWWGGG